MTFNFLGFGGTPTGHFHFQNNETEDTEVHNRQQNYGFLLVRKVIHIS